MYGAFEKFFFVMEIVKLNYKSIKYHFQLVRIFCESLEFLYFSYLVSFSAHSAGPCPLYYIYATSISAHSGQCAFFLKRFMRTKRGIAVSPM